jgi:aminocarboxymuconate-semialdehyde decarboxylase
MIVDIHTHFYLPSYLDRLRANPFPPRVVRAPDGDRFVIFAEEQAATAGRPFGPEYSSVDAKLAYMDRHGIDLSVLSLGNPWVDFMDPPEAAEWATRLNDELDALCAGQPRLRAFGVLPLQEADAACAEVERIHARPRLVGAILGTRPGGRHLDDPALVPFWATAARLKLPLFVHPHYTVGADWLGGYGHALHLGLGFTFETTAAVARLVLSGALDRHPGLTLILAHGGGTLPYLAGRLDACLAVDPQAARHLQRPFSAYLGQLYYDALVYHAAGVACALDLAGANHLLFGSDHPFSIADPAACLEAIYVAAPAQAEQITSANARRLLGLARAGVRRRR